MLKSLSHSTLTISFQCELVNCRGGQEYVDFLKIGGKHETIVQTSSSMKAGSVLGTPAGDRTGIVARENDGA